MSRSLLTRIAAVSALAIGLLALTLLLGACSPAATPAPAAPPAAPPVAATAVPPTAVPPTEVPPTAVPPTEVPPPPAPEPEPEPAVSAADLAAIQVAWESGAHNNAYDVGKGPNTYCSRCHSPLHWDINARPGRPPNCISCKFAFDAEVRIAPENPLIPEDEWKPIGCQVCHPVENGVVSPQLAIWNNATQQSEPVANSTQLCEKCHTDSIGGSMHKMQLGGGAHSNQIGQAKMRPELCTDCHDPHSLQADCKSCHAAAFEDADNLGHAPMHAKVKCQACHDASGMAVGPVPDEDYWSTAKVTSLLGRESLSFITSHNFKKGVTCTRCHFDDNPNGLKSLETPAPAGGRPSGGGAPAGGPPAGGPPAGGPPAAATPTP